LFDVLGSKLSISQKIDFIEATPDILTTSYDSSSAALLMMIVLLQGLVLSLLVWFWLQSRQASAKSLIGGGAATTVGVLGVGCTACGAGVLYPTLSGLGLGWLSSSALFGRGLMIVGVLLLIYTTHRLVIYIETQLNS
jgi:hypothetical protein